MKIAVPTEDFAGPDLTPVIDVVFLLLIFFLVATRYDQEERELEVVLPEVTQAQPLSMTPELVINVMRTGKYKIVQVEMDERQLSSIIRETHKKNPHQSALIRGDGEVALKHAVRVMGLCNEVGMDYRIAALEER
ncbi:MAG TPA: biopolymer transporter ExbD [Planctomycetaceae bacterium]|nr:biopolymer transporter ExbD [Planctomycetaceae bacterium]